VTLMSQSRGLVYNYYVDSDVTAKWASLYNSGSQPRGLVCVTLMPQSRVLACSSDGWCMCLKWI